MKYSEDLLNTLPGEDWQRMETWAAIAGMTPAQYVSLCIRRGHAIVKEELKLSNPNLVPGTEAEHTG